MVIPLSGGNYVVGKEYISISVGCEGVPAGEHAWVGKTFCNKCVTYYRVFLSVRGVAGHL